jgi:predicted transposase/invertase (TIGR01784 family)
LKNNITFTTHNYKPMAQYLDPKNDLTFKRVFGEHKHLCKSLINSMLPLEKPVVDLEYQTGELTPEIPELRNSIVDVRCTDKDGRQFIVEMQMYWSDSFTSRVVLNASKAYIKQLDKADKFKLLQPVYALNFVNEIFEKSPEMKDKYYHHYKIVNTDTGKQIKDLEFLFVELPKFKPTNRGEKLLHELWMRFLTEINETTEKISEDLLENPYTGEAVEYVKKAAYSKNQLDAYDKWKIAPMTERSAMSDARKEGEETGFVKGFTEGEAKGFIEGETKGKIEIAKQAKAMKMSVSDIAKLTGLSKEEIDTL